MSRWTMERSLLPLLDISVLLLGLFIVLMMVERKDQEQDASIFAGQNIVLVEVDYEDDRFVAYSVDNVTGQRAGAAYPLADCGDLVDEVLADADRETEAVTVVLLQMPDLQVAGKWTNEQQLDLVNALDGRRWTLLWGR